MRSAQLRRSIPGTESEGQETGFVQDTEPTCPASLYTMRGMETASGVVLEIFPEGGPTVTGRAAEKNVFALRGFFIDNSIGVSDLGDEAAAGEIGIDEALRKTDDDQRLGRRGAIAALPGGVHTTDGGRQAVRGAIQIDGADFAIILDEDTEFCPTFGRKGIADLRER